MKNLSLFRTGLKMQMRHQNRMVPSMFMNKSKLSLIFLVKITLFQAFFQPLSYDHSAQCHMQVNQDSWIKYRCFWLVQLNKQRSTQTIIDSSNHAQASSDSTFLLEEMMAPSKQSLVIEHNIQLFSCQRKVAQDMMKISICR